MAVRTLRRRLLINDDSFASNRASLRMTFVTRDIGVAALQGEMRPRIMIESGGDPSLRIVTIRARGLPGLCKLPRMRVLVTILTNL